MGRMGEGEDVGYCNGADGERVRVWGTGNRADGERVRV